jgi:hypothetical protein
LTGTAGKERRTAMERGSQQRPSEIKKQEAARTRKREPRTHRDVVGGDRWTECRQRFTQ